MILVDTSIIVAWLDSAHPEHEKCTQALENCSAVDGVALSSVTFAELSTGGRTWEALEEVLAGFKTIDLEARAAFRAGQAFSRHHPGKQLHKLILPDFLIRAQAAVLNIPHLTNDRRGTPLFPEVDFLFPA